ncbi:MAG: AAA family ATPase [Gammaproteobacteria bacterium]|nr:AAA family ATPase [Gammaproteobacteria bacterium]
MALSEGKQQQESVPDISNTKEKVAYRSKQPSTLQQRIQSLITAVSADMFEREEIISIALLAALCGQNTFLYGPPGTAKSLIARQIANIFNKPQYFEYLMNRFSTPEEVFGPVSIKSLKEDIYIRKTKNYLPTAEFAFLDEIWKASPAILNSLLTLINERIYRNGEETQDVPLKALISASNETPEADQGLDAIYDRFIVRLMVNPITDQKNFNALLEHKPTKPVVTIADDLLVTNEDLKNWSEKIHHVTLSKETIDIIHTVREAIENTNEYKIYVSDRRWQRIAILLKAAAFFNGRNTTNHSDTLILQHCLWTQESNREFVKNTVLDAVQSTGLSLNIDIEQYDDEKEALEKEITEELFYTEDVYDTRKIGEYDYFYCEAKFPLCYEGKVFDVFIPARKLKQTEEFHPCNRDGVETKKIKCQFDGQGTCVVSMFASWVGIEKFEFVPQVLFHRGEKKHDVNKRLISSLADSVGEIRAKLQQLLNEIDERKASFESELQSPFANYDQSQLAINAIIEQVNRIKLRIKDCERLEALCR